MDMLRCAGWFHEDSGDVRLARDEFSFEWMRWHVCSNPFIDRSYGLQHLSLHKGQYISRNPFEYYFFSTFLEGEKSLFLHTDPIPERTVTSCSISVCDIPAAVIRGQASKSR